MSILSEIGRACGVPPLVRVGGVERRLARPLRLVLLALLADPGHEWRAHEVAHVTGLALGRVYAPLALLEDVGWLARREPLADAPWKGARCYRFAGPDGVEQAGRLLVVPSVSEGTGR